MPLKFGSSNRQLYLSQTGRYSSHADTWAQSARASGQDWDRAQIRDSLSFEAAAAEEPFRPVAVVVVLLRSEAEGEAQVRIREAAAEVRLDLSVEEVHQESLHKVRARRLCFCVEVRVREVPAVLPVEVVPPLRPVALERAHLLKRSDRSAERLPLRLKTVH
jgi:hypothetical protein